MAFVPILFPEKSIVLLKFLGCVRITVASHATFGQRARRRYWSIFVPKTLPGMTIVLPKFGSCVPMTVSSQSTFGHRVRVGHV